MSWYSLRIEPRGDRDGVIAALFDAGAAGLQEDGSALVAYFPARHQAERAAQVVPAPHALARISEIAATDWSAAWRGTMRASRPGHLTVAPPWLSEGLDPASCVIIDPGMAFGTGEHGSTRGALRLLETCIRPGNIVADLGAGSGVLSIAAARLGAARVYAVEVDPDALGNASENIARNGVGAVVHLLDGDARILLPLLAPVDIVVANIISGVILDLLPVMRAALEAGGRAVLAGLLEEERAAISAAIERDRWRRIDDTCEEGWWSTVLEAR